VAVIRHAELNMMRQVKIKRVSLKKMRQLAGWDNSVLASILEKGF